MDGTQRDRNLTNYHTHCDYCDGRAAMEAFVQNAIAEGFTALGFSSHSPIPYPSPCNMNRERLDDYVQEFRRLKQQYGSQIELYLSLELDYISFLPNRGKFLFDYFPDYPLDYRIGSVHYVLCPEAGERQGRGELTLVDLDVSGARFDRLMCKYFPTRDDQDSLLDTYLSNHIALARHPGVDIIAHPFKMIQLFYHSRPDLVGSGRSRSYIEQFFLEAARNQKVVEVNTKNACEQGEFYPDLSVFSLMKECGCRVTVNSDAHFPNRINNGRRKALEALYDAGYREVMELHHNRWSPVSINLQCPAL